MSVLCRREEESGRGLGGDEVFIQGTWGLRLVDDGNSPSLTSEGASSGITASTTAPHHEATLRRWIVRWNKRPFYIGGAMSY